MNEPFEWEKPMPAKEHAQREPIARRRDEPPPNHPAKTLLRVILWFLPAGFAALCAVGVNMLDRYGVSPQWNFVIWLLLTIGFTIGAGWYNALLSNRTRLEPDGVFSRTVLFFFIQLFLAPLLLAAFLFAACVIHPLRF